MRRAWSMKQIVLRAAIGMVASTGPALFPATATAEPAVVRIAQADLVDPDLANAWYGAATTHTDKVCSLAPAIEPCTSGRPAKIKELARTLGAGRYSADEYAQHVLEYLYANINVEFRYGLSKGGHGALLDQSGTAFDQAHLMVELLREGGVTASYQAGKITLTADQWSDWTGITNAAAACRLLADGGIPAMVNGTGAADCAYAGTVTGVTLSHIWVAANGKLYDPSYKKRIQKPAIDIATATGCGTSCSSTVQTGAVPAGSNFQGTDSGAGGANYIQNVQSATLAAQLSTYARNLQTYIQTNALSARVEDIVGGLLTDLAKIPVAGASLPYTASMQRTWSGDIPDQYRSRLRVRFDSIDQWIFADEIQGYWLTISGGLQDWQASTTTRYTQLYLHGRKSVTGFFDSFVPYELARSVRASAGSGSGILTLDVDHPYYARSSGTAELGTYMDEVGRQDQIILTSCTSSCFNFFTPSLIINGWGRTGPTRVSLASEQAGSYFVDQNFPTIACPGTTVACEQMKNGSTVIFAATWLSQATQALQMVDGINNTVSEHHHTIGIATSAQSSASVDARSNLSILSRGNSSADRQAAVHSGVAMLSGLEGGAFEQTNDTWHGAAAISMFALANEKAVRFLEVTPANLEAVLAATTNYAASEKDVVRSYINSGSPSYNAIISQNGDIGPFNYMNWTTTYTAAPLLAYSLDGLRLAYASTSGTKAAGGGDAGLDTVLKTVQATDPTKKRDEIYKVDLAGGNLTLTPPPDLVVGQGDYPFSLPFQRYFDASTVQPDSVYWLPHPSVPIFTSVTERQQDLPWGWRHKYEITARLANDGSQGLGADSALDASAAIASLYVLRALSTEAPTFKSRVVSIFTTRWLLDQLMGNAVVVTRPPQSETFIRLPDGRFNGAPASATALVQSGSRTRVILGRPGFNYVGITLTLTDKDGGVISFGTGDYNLDGARPSNPAVYTPRFVANSHTFPDGVVVSFQYAGETLVSGNAPPTAFRVHLTSVSNSLGRALSIVRPTEEYLLSVSDGNGQVVNFDTVPVAAPEEADGFTDTMGRSVTYRYERVGPNKRNLVKVLTAEKPNAPLVTFTYDADFRVKTAEDRDGNVTHFYPAKVASEKLGRGERVGAQSDAALRSVQTTYFNDANLPVQSIDPVGRVTSYTYDGANRIKRVTSPEGNAVEYGYDARHNVTEERRKPKSGTGDLVTTKSYFTGPAAVTCPSNETKRCNQVASVDGPRTDVVDMTTFSYHSGTGQIATITGPAVTGGNPLTTFLYTNFSGTTGTISLLTSRVERIDQATDVTTAYGYETLANKLALRLVTVDPGALNLSTQVTYDAVGNVRSITNPRGKVTQYCFDRVRRLTRVTRQIGSLDHSDCAALPAASGDDIVTVYEYNADNYLTRSRGKDAFAGVWRDTRYTYTSSDLLDTVTDPQDNVTNYDYDALQREAMVTDAAGRRIRTFYFADGTIRRILKAYGFASSSTNEACSVSGSDQQCYARYTYTPNGNQWTVMDANGNTTTMVYDIHDRLDTTTFPDGSFEKLTYDGNSNVRTKRNRAAEIIEQTYDALNRALTKSHPSFPAMTYGYDLLSRRTSVSQSGGQALSWIYDKAGRVRSTTAGTRTIGYEYDGAGNRTRVTWPDGFFVIYEYDDADRMDIVRENGGTQVLADYLHDTLSRRKDLSRPNGDSTAYTYEPDSDLESITHNGLPGTPQISFTYNPAHQIRTRTVNLNALQWVPQANSSTSYAPNNLNQYGSVGGVTYSYDGKGNLTSAGPTTFTYDAENRLTSAIKDGVTTAYTYDGLGRRIAKQAGTTVTQFLLDGDEEIAEYDGAGALLRRYVYGPTIDDRIVMYESTGTDAANERFYYTNHQGSTLQIADGSGNVTETFTYSPYGETFGSNGFSPDPTGNPFRFTGRRFDRESGLYYYRARYYSPVLGRFLQTDPIGYKDDLNLYSYARNDPLTWLDPRGTEVAAAFRQIYLADGGKSQGVPTRTLPRQPLEHAIVAGLAAIAVAPALALLPEMLASAPALNSAVITAAEVGAGDALGTSTLAVTGASAAVSVTDKVFGPFHRLRDSAAVVQAVRQSGELWGQPPRNTFRSDFPQVKAYDGPLPDDAKGFEFTTTVPPDSGTPPGRARWTGPREGVEIRDDTAVIRCVVTKVQPCL